MAHILVLDDELDAVVLLKRLFEGKGHRVFGFTEEEEAIAHARANSVDLAIIDIRLKKMLGVEVLEELKKIAPQIRAVLLTGYPTLESAQKAFELGVSEYLVKPVDIGELEEKVEKILSSGGE
ncbi:MAG: response regulator [Deltaproteobacteria bacterium]|nr:MAG: response regulator [Deltaproteobacteria bacterium]